MNGTSPKASETIAKICSYAMISALDFHPHKEAMNNVLALKIAGEKGYRLLADQTVWESLEETFEHTRAALAEQAQAGETVEAYALLIDSAHGVQGMPEGRPVDEEGRAYPQNQNYVFMFAGEAGHPEALQVVQAYACRRWRSGAAPLGAPLIEAGPDSLLF